MKDCSLYCTSCNKKFPLIKGSSRCDVCGEPLEVEKFIGKIKEGNFLTQKVLKRYQEFFPFLEKELEFSLGEGFTPLIENKKLANEIGISNLWFKNETMNPTWSFKDRGTVSGVLYALSQNYKKIGTVSTGNMAVSVAAYGKLSNLSTYVFVSDNIPEEKLNPIAIHGANLVKVVGDYGDLYYKALELGERNEVCFINSDSPFRVLGYKTLAFEICEQLNFDIPNFVIVPTGAGGNIRGIIRGFEEFYESGYINKIPTFVSAQSKGVNPIDLAFKNNEEKISRVKNPKTITGAIGNPFPPSGNRVLKLLKENKGYTIASTNEEIIIAQKTLAENGLFVQPASACSYSGLIHLIKEGIVTKNDTVACVLTGSGLKCTAIFEKHNLSSKRCNIDNLDSILK